MATGEQMDTLKGRLTSLDVEARAVDKRLTSAEPDKKNKSYRAFSMGKANRAGKGKVLWGPARNPRRSRFNQGFRRANSKKSVGGGLLQLESDGRHASRGYD